MEATEKTNSNEETNKQLEQDQEETLDKCRQIEMEFYNKEKANREKIAQLEKENAILQQKYQFSELQLNDNKKKLEQLKKNEQLMFNQLGDGNSSSDQTKAQWEKKLTEICERHNKEIIQKQKEIDSYKEFYNSKIDDLKEQLQELQRLNTVQKTEYDNNCKELQSENEQLKQQIEELKKKQENQEAEQNAIENQAKQQFESENEQIQSQISLKDGEIAQLKQQIDKLQLDLKSQYEGEKYELEKRLNDQIMQLEKEKKEIAEQLEAKFATEKSEMEEVLNQLNEKYLEQQNSIEEVKQQQLQELQIKDSKIKSLEKVLNDSSSNFKQVTEQQNEQFKQSLSKFDGERTQHQNLVESLKCEINKKDLAISKLEEEKLNLANANQKLESEAFEKIKAQQNETQKGQSEIIQIKQRQEFIQQQNIDLQVQIDLKSQEVNFLTEKNEKYLQEIEKLKFDFQKKISENSDGNKQQIQKLCEEKKVLEEKLEKMKGNINEIEKFYGKQLDKLEKDKLSLNQQYNLLEHKHSTLKKEMEEEKKLWDNKFNEANVNYSQDIIALKDENSSLTIQLHDLEQKYKELSNEHQMDKELYEERIKFVDAQKEKIKQDLNDSQNKFTLTLEKIQQMREQDKLENEESQSALLKAIERRNQQKLEEIENYNNRKMVQLEEQIQDKNQEIKQLRVLYQQSQQRPCEKCEALSKSLNIDGMQKEQFVNYQKLKESFEVENKMLQEKLKCCESKCQELENFRSSAKKIFEETQLIQVPQVEIKQVNKENDLKQTSVSFQKQPYFQIEDGQKNRRNTFITPSRVDILRNSSNQVRPRESAELSHSVNRSKTNKKELNFTTVVEKSTVSKGKK